MLTGQGDHLRLNPVEQAIKRAAAGIPYFCFNDNSGFKGGKYGNQPATVIGDGIGAK
jgi:hypothetical protein